MWINRSGSELKVLEGAARWKVEGCRSTLIVAQRFGWVLKVVEWSATGYQKEQLRQGVTLSSSSKDRWSRRCCLVTSRPAGVSSGLTASQCKVNRDRGALYTPYFLALHIKPAAVEPEASPPLATAFFWNCCTYPLLILSACRWRGLPVWR